TPSRSWGVKCQDTTGPRVHRRAATACSHPWIAAPPSAARSDEAIQGSNALMESAEPRAGTPALFRFEIDHRDRGRSNLRDQHARAAGIVADRRRHLDP